MRGWLLVLVVLLSGCGAREAAAPVPIPEEVPPAEDALLVNGREVPLWLYDYWLQQAAEQAADRYAQAGERADFTGSLGEAVRQQALSDAALCAVVESTAQAWGCGLTVEDFGALDRLWAQRAAQHGGEEVYRAHLRAQGLTEAQARYLGQLGLLYRKLHREAASPESPHHALPEQLAAFEAESGAMAVECISASGEGAAQKIGESFARLNDCPACFSQLAQGGPRSLLPGDGTLPPALEAACADLEIGQHSGILSTGEGFCILRRARPSTAFLTARYLDARLRSAVRKAAVQAPPELSRRPIPVLP